MTVIRVGDRVRCEERGLRGVVEREIGGPDVVTGVALVRDASGRVWGVMADDLALESAAPVQHGPSREQSAVERAREVAAMPHVLAWMRSYAALFNVMPTELWAFSARAEGRLEGDPALAILLDVCKTERER